MCNRLHHDSKPIPKKGYGYKLFYMLDGKPTQLYGVDGYDTSPDKWIRWNRGSSLLAPGTYGFCFFRTRQAAQLVFERYHRVPFIVLSRIQYREGLGRHIEKSMIEDMKIPIALCKEFKILDDLQEKLESLGEIRR